MGSAHAAGEQVFIDYAGEGNWRSSWEMLYTYGFVPGGALRLARSRRRLAVLPH